MFRLLPIVLLALASSAAAASDLPGLTVPPTGERHPGKMIFAELVTPDLAAAERFYTTLFGWSFQDAQTGQTRYAQASLDGQVVAGIVERPLPAGRRPAWLSFMAAGNLTQVDAFAVQHGAKVLFRAHPLANLGQQAVLADPQGAVFGVLASSSGDPPDLLADTGTWIWSSLIATDPATDAAFYHALLGYDVIPLPEPGDANHLILASENFARASVNPMPGDRPGAHPRWISYLRVDDAEAMTTRVAALGGRIVVPPHLDRHGGKIAIVADPSGALFGLLEWTETSPPAAPQ